MKKRILVAIAVISIVFSGIAFVRPAKATFPVAEIPGKIIDQLNLIENTVSEIFSGYEWFDNVSDSFLLPALKSVLIQVVNQAITGEFSSGNSGKPYFVTNWQDYLYKEPANAANKYVVNDFLSNQLTGGKCKDANYQGSPYYKYMCQQGETAIQKTTPKTTLPEYTSDPQANLFAEGDLRAFNAYFECGNNPYCTADKTKQTYGQIQEQEQKKAEKEAGADGTLPKKNTDGSISVPGSVFGFSINDAISLGNQTIVNAQEPEDLMISIVSRMALNALQGGFNSGGSSGGTGSAGTDLAKSQECNDRCWTAEDKQGCMDICMK